MTHSLLAAEGAGIRMFALQQARRRCSLRRGTEPISDSIIVKWKFVEMMKHRTITYLGVKLRQAAAAGGHAIVGLVAGRRLPGN